MGRHDWYRRTSWSEKDQTEFFERLHRSRSSFRKAQYARIQAHSLQQTNKAKLIEAALSLLNMVLEQWPEKTQLALVHSQMGDSYIFQGKLEEGLKEYQAAMQEQRKFPHSFTTAHLLFGLIVVEYELKIFYSEALQALQDFGGYDGITPRTKYEHFAILAIIAYNTGNHTEAIQYAREAMQEAEKNKSWMPYHSTLGLVKDKNTKIHKMLLSIFGDR